MAKILLAALLSPLTAAGGIHRDHSSLKPSYDYVVAGGGLTGLVVGTRLSENPNSMFTSGNHGNGLTPL